MDYTNCLTLTGIDKSRCLKVYESLTKVENKLDDVQTQIYIISGVFGGVALILIIILIALAVRFGSLRQEALKFTGNTNIKPKPTPEHDMATRNVPFGNNGDSTHLRHAPPHTFVQPPNTMSSEQELAQRGFSAYTGHPVESRGQSTSPVVNSAGGVRVLPRNPPSAFRNTGAFNEGYM